MNFLFVFLAFILGLLLFCCFFVALCYIIDTYLFLKEAHRHDN